MQAAPQVISVCPSFNSYSNINIAEIASRVVREQSKSDVNDGDQFEFEFATSNASDLSSPISAEDIFYNGKIRPVYPVFNRDILFGGHVKIPNIDSTETPKIRLPLRKLFNEERETAMTMTTTSSSSSSEADDLNGVAEETYCVWTPKNNNSKRWKFKDLLIRSRSDGGKNNLVFPTQNGRGRKNEAEIKLGNVKLTEAEPCKTNLVGLFGKDMQNY